MYFGQNLGIKSESNSYYGKDAADNSQSVNAFMDTLN